MAAVEWVVLVKHLDGSYREVARPVVETDFDALQSVPPESRSPEMYAVKAERITTFILIPEGDRPSDVELVRMLPDGTLALARSRTATVTPV